MAKISMSKPGLPPGMALPYDPWVGMKATPVPESSTESKNRLPRASGRSQSLERSAMMMAEGDVASGGIGGGVRRSAFKRSGVFATAITDTTPLTSAHCYPQAPAHQQLRSVRPPSQGLLSSTSSASLSSYSQWHGDKERDHQDMAYGVTRERHNDSLAKVAIGIRGVVVDSRDMQRHQTNHRRCHGSPRDVFSSSSSSTSVVRGRTTRAPSGSGCIELERDKAKKSEGASRGLGEKGRRASSLPRGSRRGIAGGTGESSSSLRLSSWSSRERPKGFDATPYKAKISFRGR